MLSCFDCYQQKKQTLSLSGTLKHWMIRKKCNRLVLEAAQGETNQLCSSFGQLCHTFNIFYAISCWYLKLILVKQEEKTKTDILLSRNQSEAGRVKTRNLPQWDRHQWVLGLPAAVGWQADWSPRLSCQIHPTKQSRLSWPEVQQFPQRSGKKRWSWNSERYIKLSVVVVN